MAKNYIQKGDTLDLTIAAGAASGAPVMAGNIPAVVLATIAAAGHGACRRIGVFDLSVKAINDAGNSAVAIGDAIYYTAADTPVLSKKSSGKLFGYALEAIDTGETDTINVLLAHGHTAELAAGSVSATELADDAVTEDKILDGAVTQNKIGAGAVIEAKLATDAVTSAKIKNDEIKQTKLNRRFTFEEFQSNPITSKIGGGAATGTGGDENVMQFEENNFEYHILGTQTILAPSLVATGLNVGMDQTNDDGVEIGQGITAKSRAAFVVGTDAAFYAKCKFSIGTVAGTDDCAFGFRKAEAYQANIDDYDEMACLNVISGDINIETILNGGETTTTDTEDDWADGETHTLEVYVSAAGVVTYKIDGVAPTTTAAFTFDAAEVVVPFFYLLNADAAQAGQVVLQEWEVGLQ